VVFTNADFLKVQGGKDAILSALNVFFMRHPDWVLDFFGDPFPEMFSLPFLHFTNRMPYQEYMRAIVSGDYMFAITPLGADEDAESAAFNACKNPFKFINYGVARIPGIYSSAKIYTDCIEHGKTGLLVVNEFEAWLDAMEQYAASPDLRRAVSDSAYEVVMRDFHVRDGARVFMGLLERFCLHVRV
jgi:glycosyltransferase involved in cell wall biosynthesis